MSQILAAIAKRIQHPPTTTAASSAKPTLETSTARLLTAADYKTMAKETAELMLPQLKAYSAWSVKQGKAALTPKIQLVINAIEKGQLPSAKTLHVIMNPGYKLKVIPYLNQLGMFMFMAGLYPNFGVNPVV